MCKTELLNFKLVTCDKKFIFTGKMLLCQFYSVWSIYLIILLFSLPRGILEVDIDLVLVKPSSPRYSIGTTIVTTVYIPGNEEE